MPERRAITPTASRAHWSLLTPPAPGAIAIIALQGEPRAIDDALAALGVRPLAPRAAQLAALRHTGAHLDRAVVARWSPRLAHLMLHGGPLVISAVAHALEELAIPASPAPTSDADLCDLYPEAADLHEARALLALAHAASPLAVDLLLDQPRRWREVDAGARHEVTPQTARRLGHLLRPALVVAVGASNIGKSSLINALAGRTAAIVADEPGTTRDHVGVHLDLAGLVVRWLDTPGIRDSADEIEREAIDLALHVAASADLLIHCVDLAGLHPAPRPAPPAPQLAELLAAARAPVLRVGLRADLASGTTEDPIPRVSIHDRASLDAVASHVRAALLGGALTDPGAWRFWDR